MRQAQDPLQLWADSQEWITQWNTTDLHPLQHECQSIYQNIGSTYKQQLFFKWWVIACISYMHSLQEEGISVICSKPSGQASVFKGEAASQEAGGWSKQVELWCLFMFEDMGVCLGTGYMCVKLSCSLFCCFSKVTSRIQQLEEGLLPHGSSLVSRFCIHGAWMMVIWSDRSLLARSIVRKLNCLEMTTLLPQQTLSCHSPFGLN